MKSKRLLVSRLIVILMLVGCIAAPTLAATRTEKEKARRERIEKKKKESAKINHTLGPSMHKKLNESLELLRADVLDFEALEAILLPLAKKSDRLKPYARALVYQLLGSMESSRERYPEALTYLEQCLATESMPYSAQVVIRYQVAQLYLATEKYEDSIRTLLIWFEEAENPNSAAYSLLAIAYYQNDEVEKAVEPAEIAVAIAEEPEERWVRLLAGLYFETEQWTKAIIPLEELVSRFSKKMYWVQLSALYANEDRGEEALAVLQLAYEQDLLEKDNELTQLAKMYLHYGLPFRAALVVEKGLADEVIESNTDSWELLANSWLLAREHSKAVEPLTLAAELSEDGELFVRLGQVYLERDNWGDAAKALENAVEKAGLKDSGHVNLLLGISFYNQDKPNQARKYFKNAQESESFEKTATQWLAMLARGQ